MDIIRLSNTTFLPDYLVEGYSSMIWTERYLEAGEFELRSYDINEMLQMLPVADPSLISLVDSKEVMIVESHSLEVDDNGVQTLVTRGKALDSFLGQRTIHGLSGVAYKMPKQYNIPGAAEILIWNSVVNNTGYDVLANSPDRDQYDCIPGVVVSESLAPGAFPTTSYWWLQPGYIHPTVLEYLSRGSLGLRCIRPPSPEAYVVTFSNTWEVSGSGIISRTQEYDVPDLRFDVYSGTDRSLQIESPPLDAIKFSEQLGDFDKPQFLFAINDLKRCGHATSTIVQTDHYYNGDETTFQGLKKRWLFFDGGSDFGSDPVHISDTEAALDQKLDVMLRQRQKTLYFDSAVSPFSAYVYGQDYFLGDTVKLIADHGFDETVKILEYVRTEGEEGDVGYPTFTFVEPEA